MMRVAHLTYLNCAPFYWGCEEWNLPLVPCVPRELGEMAARGEVDVGPMAVVDWFALEGEFEPIGPYGIASQGSVLSVLLFSSKPIQALAGTVIAVTEETSTSFRLLQLLLEHRYGLRGCSYRRGEEGEACLLIGDAALKEMKRAKWPFVYDLAEEWQRWQGSPFVFARWVIRRSLPAEDKRQFQSLLDQSYNKAMADLDDVARHYLGHGALQEEEIVAYLRNLVFVIGEEEERGLAEFKRLLEDKAESAKSKEPWRTIQRRSEKGGLGMWDDIERKVLNRERLTTEEGIFLLTEADLLALGGLAQEVRFGHNPQPYVTFLIDSNPNYTNICDTDCLFCAFYRKPGAADGYWLTVEQVMEKVAYAVSRGATTVLLQGGHNPAIPLDYYLELVRETRRRFPQVTPHFFSASEIQAMSRYFNMSVREILVALTEAGQYSLPGGGAEILSQRARQRIAAKKGMPEDWLAVHREAHRLGWHSTATMMYGHIESPEDILEHWNYIRDLQDETGGFTAFVPWSFKPTHTYLSKWVPVGAGPNQYLRMIAGSRLYLDNFPHVQASWFSEGKKTGQVALHFGADDFGGTLIEENVHAAAAYVNKTTTDETLEIIRESGFTPARRTTLYKIVEIYDGAPKHPQRGTPEER